MYRRMQDRVLSRPFVLTMLTEFALCTSIGMLLAVVPVYADDRLGVGSFGVALAVAAVSPMVLICQPLAGRFGDRRGRKLLIVAGGAGASTISLAVFFVPGNGDGSFGPPVAVGADQNPNAIAIADINGDRHLDIISANYEGYDFSINLGSGTGKFSSPVLWGAGQAPAHVLAVDLNRDGGLDIVTANHFSDTLTVALHRRF